ncbi:MAG: ABC transporter ATP-binding protein [Anaerolineales bacterium]|nr:ABC transporter ATP-binding protein [Anaerolineales bacterium]
MARIKLHNVSLTYDAPLHEPVHKLFATRKESIQEDLPVETKAGITALDHVNLTVPHGQIFVVVGPSGCGKSTLLRVIAGIEKNYTGTISYDGEDMQSVPPGDRYIGMVFQNYALYPNFTGEGNLSFFFRMHKIGNEETRERIRYTSELMGIGFKELLPRQPGTLSGGEKQRVAIARAIVRAPRLFLFDEPLSNLDAKLRAQTRSEIKRLLHRFAITSLYVTHDQVEAIALADQIVIMHEGKIEQVGTYQNLMEHPVNLFVAGFLGLPPMSLFTGGLISGNKLVLDDYLIPLPKLIASLVQDGQAVTLGLRPEAVSVSADLTSTSGIQLRGEVEAFESDYVHHLQIVHLCTGSWRYAGLCPLALKLRVGQLVKAHIDSDHLYFFETKSGLRL